MLECAKTISCLIREVLGIVRAHIYTGCLDVHSLAAGAYLVSILQAGDWACIFTPDGHWFSTCITTTGQHQDLVQHSVLGLNK